MTVRETGVIMEVIRLAYPKTGAMSQTDAEKTLTLWATMFEEVPYDDVRNAVKAFILTDTKGYPPTIGQINSLITEAKMASLPSAEEAWGYVRKAIGNGLYGAKEEYDALPEICKRVVATPSNIYDWASLDNKGLNVVRSTFLSRYREVLGEVKELVALPTKVAENRKALTEGQTTIKALAEGVVK